MGFDAALADGLRILRAIGQASISAMRRINRLRSRPCTHLACRAWRAVLSPKTDIVYANRSPTNSSRVFLADPSIHVRGTPEAVRFATAMLMTAPGVPMLFMGQEILEDKTGRYRRMENTLVVGMASADPLMRDFLRFTKDLIRLRKDYGALSGPGINVFHVNNAARVIGFHRWLPGTGDDVVVVGTLSEANLNDYEIGFPQSGTWREIFNSDVYESSPGHQPAGNAGQVVAEGPPLHGLPSSARIQIPANGVLAFAR
jgi:1,4-alpha-glucan branching enzyme